MAVTSLWHIKGNLKDLIDYVENPDKTVPKGTEDFFNVFSYVQNPAKTEKGEYVSAVNCLKETALQQMILTKKRYGKDDKYIAWHGYQSFQVGEVSPETAHEIGVKLAREMWGDKYQIVVTTHLDKDHIHNHFAFNSVSFLDGKKYNYSNAERQRLRDASDRLCREYGLSVINNPHKAPSRPVWLDEKAGKPTRYNVYREDISNAMYCSNNLHLFEKFIVRKGYEVDFSGKHWKVKLPQYKGFTRLDTLNEKWTPEFIEQEIRRTYRSFGSIPATVITIPPQMPRDLYDAYTPFKRTNHIYRLYLYYCYQLGYLPKGTDYKPTSPYLKEAVRKLDEITAQVTYMSVRKINTLEELYADRELTEKALTVLCEQREKLRNKIRRALPEDKETLRKDKAELTEKITVLRKELKCNYAIEGRSVGIQDTLDMVTANEIHNKELRQQEKQTKKKEGYSR